MVSLMYGAASSEVLSGCEIYLAAERSVDVG